MQAVACVVDNLQTPFEMLSLQTAFKGLSRLSCTEANQEEFCYNDVSVCCRLGKAGKDTG